jgi:hypothetical protein
MTRNHFTSLLQFMQRWDEAAVPQTRSEQGNRISRDGRINLAGTEACPKAIIYTRRDKEFVESLEPGVRRLVLTLVESFDCLTYSSCEGHRHPTSGGTPSLRHVGILPRNADEYDALIRIISRVASMSNQRFPGGAVKVLVVERVLSSDDLEAPCFEVMFERAKKDWPIYFSQLEEVYELFLKQLMEAARERTASAVSRGLKGEEFSV